MVVMVVATVVGADAIFLPEAEMGMMIIKDRMTVMTTMVLGDGATHMSVITTTVGAIHTSETTTVTITTAMAEMIVGITDKVLHLETTEAPQLHVQLMENVIHITVAATMPILVLQPPLDPLLASHVTKLPRQDQRIVPLARTLHVMHLSLLAKLPAAQHIRPRDRLHQRRLVNMPRKATLPAPIVNLLRHTPAPHKHLAVSTVPPPPQHPIPDPQLLQHLHIHPVPILKPEPPRLPRHLPLLIHLLDRVIQPQLLQAIIPHPLPMPQDLHHPAINILLMPLLQRLQRILLPIAPPEPIALTNRTPS